MTESTPLAKTVAATRAFTRFYTGFAGTLSNRLYKSRYALPQVRVIHEIATGPADTPAADMARALKMDAGQLSRILSRLERDGLVRREPTETNAKRLKIELTEEGQAAFAQFDRAAQDEMCRELAPLSDHDRTRLVRAMALIADLLGRKPHPAATVTLREPQPGDLGWVVEREAALYAGEYGWNHEFEVLVLGILADFAATRDPARERGWIAELEGERIGAVFVVRKDDETAKLRLLHVERAARGHGVGRQLVDACIDWSRQAGYSRIELWTNDNLVSARRIFIHAGFTKVSEEPHVSFGHNLVGQVWARDL